jgi:hypothetical protein
MVCTDPYGAELAEYLRQREIEVRSQWASTADTSWMPCCNRLPWHICQRCLDIQTRRAMDQAIQCMFSVAS